MTCQKVSLAECSKRLHGSETPAELKKVNGGELGAMGMPDKNQRCSYSKPQGKRMLSVNQDALILVSGQRKKTSSLE